MAKTLPKVNERLPELAEAVEGYLRDALAQRALPGNLADAAVYAVFGPGKRLRPALALLCCEAVGGKAADALPAASAVELIHTFSLVHDDLPAMDDDDLRRGRATLHKHTNEAMAILTGDFMHVFAFEVLTTRVSDASVAGALVRELSLASGDMIAGQVYDTLPPWEEPGYEPEGEDEDDAVERVEKVHRHKTAALIRAACRMGAVSAQATGAQLKAVGRYGEAVGLMFQVIDDVLDVTGSAEELGKATQKDEAAGKLTYPGVLGLDMCHAEVERLLGEATEAAAELGEGGKVLTALAMLLAERTR